MNKHKSNKIKENSNTVRHLIMGQIITTQNLVATKVVRLAGQWHICKLNLLIINISTWQHFYKYTYWVSVQNWFAFWPRWPNFGPLMATKWHKNGERPSVRPGFPTIIWKSNHSIHFKFGVGISGWVFRTDSLLGDVGPKWLTMGQNGGFRPLSEKVFTQFNSNLMGTLIEWVSRKDLLFGHVGQILGT